MIDKAYGEFTLTCDICGEKAPCYFVEFDGAVRYKKAFGWKSKLEPALGWQDVCPECQEVGE